MVATTSQPVPCGQILRFILPLVLGISGLALFTPTVSAGEEVPDITFRILKLDCEEDPGQVPDGVTPEGCTPVEGVAFEDPGRG